MIATARVAHRAPVLTRYESTDVMKSVSLDPHARLLDENSYLTVVGAGTQVTNVVYVIIEKTESRPPPYMSMPLALPRRLRLDS